MTDAATITNISPPKKNIIIDIRKDVNAFVDEMLPTKFELEARAAPNDMSRDPMNRKKPSLARLYPISIRTRL